MSMQICVFADRLLDSISEWQRAIDAESFPLWLSNDVPLSEVDGVLPADWATSQPVSSFIPETRRR